MGADQVTERPKLLEDVCFAEKRLLGQIKEQEGDLHLFIWSAKAVLTIDALNAHHTPAL